MTNKSIESSNKTIYVCGYCDEVLPQKTILKHIKRIHNVNDAEPNRVITKVVMI